MTKLTPFALKDAPALIESVFPAQKVSFEAQKERKANLGQTLTGLGSYWKGRKPLILVRAIVLGSLLPQTGTPEEDLEIFEKLMAFDDEGLARRALVQNALNPAEIAARIDLDNPWDFFQASTKGSDLSEADIASMSLPLDATELGLKLSWQRGLSDDEKLPVFRKLIASLATYEEKASIAKRPEELDEAWLLQPVWIDIQRAYQTFGIKADSIAGLVEQLGILRFGHRPRLGDTFAGAGSIPFEAARVGCHVYASDLNPVACMLTWGALNIVGASEKQRREIENHQRVVAANVDEEITRMGIEHDADGNRAKSYLYVLEARCPETGWLVPVVPSWVISKPRKVVARLVPNFDAKAFDIEIIENASKAEFETASKGTMSGGALEYTLEGKNYRTPIKTIRGDYKDTDGSYRNRLRAWNVDEISPRDNDIFRERLFAIQWIKRDSLDENRHKTFFRAPTEEDWAREKQVQDHLSSNLQEWQRAGFIPDMEIEPGYNTAQPIRERGWTHWHHLFNARQLLLHALYFKHRTPEDYIFNAKALDWNSRIANWMIHWEKTNNVFYNQALNTFYNYGTRCFVSHEAGRSFGFASSPLPAVQKQVCAHEASQLDTDCDLWITDPPYADAVNYHEITEFFIAWLRKSPPAPFDEWVWDSRRALAIKGSGDDFRKGMVDAYQAMADHMPDNGMQCVMFTHQDTGVWSDMIGIFWAAGLQVVAAWYIATETTSELKKGGYVQGTVILMLRKRAAGDKPGFKQRILPAVRKEVASQIESMLNLNDEVKDKMGEPVFNDSDLQMAGYAAALKVLTAYTQIGGEDVTSFALRPKAKGEVTVVDEIVQQAAEAANSLLVPEGLSADTWARLSGIQRFYLRMMDMETTGASKLDNYQNFAKAFRVDDYTKVMHSVSANSAKLKGVMAFETRDLTDSTEIGGTWLGRLIIGLRQINDEAEPQIVLEQIQFDLPDFLEVRAILVDLMDFFESKAPEKEVRDAAEVLGARLKNVRAIGN